MNDLTRCHYGKAVLSPTRAYHQSWPHSLSRYSRQHQWLYRSPNDSLDTATWCLVGKSRVQRRAVVEGKSATQTCCHLGGVAARPKQLARGAIRLRADARVPPQGGSRSSLVNHARHYSFTAPVKKIESTNRVQLDVNLAKTFICSLHDWISDGVG